MSRRRRTPPAKTRGLTKVTRYVPGEPAVIMSVEYVTPPKGEAAETIDRAHEKYGRQERDT